MKIKMKTSTTKQISTITTIKHLTSVLNTVKYLSYFLDAGATRIKRIPLHQLKVEDENQIPAKPDVILEKPNDKHYEKLIKDLKDKIEYHQKSKQEIAEKITKEKYGNNPEIEKLKKVKDDLFTEIEPLSKELKETRDLCKGPSDELKNLRALKSQLTNELEITDIDDFNEEIKKIQKKLGFSTLNAPEEKKLIEKKNKLEDQKPKIEKLNQTKKRINDLYTKFGPSLKKVTELAGRLRVLTDKRKENSTKLGVQYDNKKSNDPAINNLLLQRESINQENSKLKEQIFELEKEWEDKWYHYEQQQKLLDYINEATKKITMLRKKEEKDQKRREKDLRKNKNVEEDDNVVVVTTRKVDHFGYEISQCEWLIRYFKGLTIDGKSVQEGNLVKDQKTNVQSKIDEDLKTGALKEYNRNEKSEVNSSLSFAKSKKKKPEKKKAGNDFLALDISLISRIKELELTPPVFIDLVRPFVDELERKLKFYLGEAEKKLEETRRAEENSGEV